MLREISEDPGSNPGGANSSFSRGRRGILVLQEVLVKIV